MQSFAYHAQHTANSEVIIQSRKLNPATALQEDLLEGHESWAKYATVRW